jgi:hypothetical protein
MLCTIEKPALFSDALLGSRILHDHGIEVNSKRSRISWRRYKVCPPVVLRNFTIIHNHKHFSPPTNNMNFLILFAMFASIAYAQDGARILTNQTL